jgi:hypothetical protein
MLLTVLEVRALGDQEDPDKRPFQRQRLDVVVPPTARHSLVTRYEVRFDPA